MTKPDNFHFERNFISNPAQWFWDLLPEFYDAGPSEVKYGGSRVSAITLRTPDLPADVRRAAKTITGDGSRRRLDLFGPHTAMIASRVAEFTGHMPDMCTLNLYRNGDDYLRPHHDPEWLYGPTLDNVVISTVSFGATRLLRHREIGFLDQVAAEYPAEAGSLAVMRGNFQRELFHEIVRDETKDARLSLTFTCAQQDLPDGTCWYLMESSPEATALLEANGYGLQNGRDIELATKYLLCVGGLEDIVAEWGHQDLEEGPPLAAFHPATEKSFMRLEDLLEKHPELKERLPEEHPLLHPPEENYLDDTELLALDAVPWGRLPPEYMKQVKNKIYNEEYRRSQAAEKEDS